MSDSVPKQLQFDPNQNHTVSVSPFYHEAKNEITRADRSVFCSQYFVARWMPRLGATAACIVLFLRSLGGGVREGEIALQVNQDQIALAARCSDRTVRREIAENKELQRFVRMEDRFEQGERGRIRRIESVYYVAMDDPIVEEDEPLLQEIIKRKAAPRAAENKIITPARLLGQNVLIGEANRDLLGQIVLIGHEIESGQNRPTVAAKLSEQNPKDSESYINVSESRFRGVSETDSGYIPFEEKVEEKAKRLAQKYGGEAAANPKKRNEKDAGKPEEKSEEKIPEKKLEKKLAGREEYRQGSENTPPQARTEKNSPVLSGGGFSVGGGLELWRKKTEELARYSASELGDQPSLGFHIKVWNHARKADRQAPEVALMADRMFAVLQNLIERRRQTGLPQGKAWTRRVRKLFEESGCPMLVTNDEQELQEVRAALKAAPFLQDPPTES